MLKGLLKKMPKPLFSKKEVLVEVKDNWLDILIDELEQDFDKAIKKILRKRRQRSERWDKPFLEAAREGDIKGVLNAFINGACVDAKDIIGMTALMHACASGNIKMAKILLCLGADINEEDLEGETPIFYAVRWRQKHMVEFLIKKGADKDKESRAIGYQGMKPIDIASYIGEQEIVDALKNSQKT